MKRNSTKSAKTASRISELLGLIQARSACYLHAMENDFRYPRGLLAIGGLRLRAKMFFDGTKLPLVVGPSQNHNRWYIVSLS